MSGAFSLRTEVFRLSFQEVKSDKSTLAKKYITV